MNSNDFDTHDPVFPGDNKATAGRKIRLEINGYGSTYGNWWGAMGLAEDTRYCWWAGKTDNNRKDLAATENLDDPWDGCSDAEVKLAEMLSNEHTETLLAAAMVSPEEMVAPVESGDRLLAEKGKALLRWELARMPEKKKALRLFATRRNDYGVSVMWVDWHRRQTVVERAITLPEVMEAAGLGGVAEYALAKDERGAWFAQALEGVAPIQTPEDQEAARALGEVGRLLRPAAEKEALKFLGELFPEMKAHELRELAQSLASTGQGMVQVPSVAENRLRWECLTPGDTVFWSANAEHLQDAPGVRVRRFMTVGQLRAMTSKVHGEGAWSKKFVEAVIEAGHGSPVGTTLLERREKVRKLGGQPGMDATATEAAQRLFEVWLCWTKQVDERGVETLRHTVLSNVVGEDDDFVGLDQVVPGVGGRYPFVLGVFRWESDQILDNMGIPAMVKGGQQTLKVLRDGRIDLSDLARRPPAIKSVRDRSRSEQDEWRPGGMIYEGMRGTASHATVNMQGFAPSGEMSREVYAEQLRLAGSPGEASPPEVVATHAKVGVLEFLDEYAEVLKMSWQLLQQNLDETTVLRVTGPLGQPFTVGQEDIAGSWDLNFLPTPEILGMAPDMLKVRDEIIQSIVGSDFAGVLDRTKVLIDRLRAVDPHAADRWLTNPEAATEAEVEDEIAALGQIAGGVEPPMKGRGQNVALRRQVLTEALQKMPAGQKIMQDESLKALVENRLKHFDWVEQQQKNAQIGRETGVKPIMPR